MEASSPKPAGRSFLMPKRCLPRLRTEHRRCGPYRGQITAWRRSRSLAHHHRLPKGLHRIRHDGLFANGNRAANIARARELLGVPSCSRAQRSERTVPAGRTGPRSIQGLPVAPPDLIGIRELDFLFGDLGELGDW